jgi:hypothetical protein
VFALKNRGRADWRDVVEQKHTGDKNNPVAIEAMTAREVIAGRIALLAIRNRTPEDSSVSDGEAG